MIEDDTYKFTDISQRKYSYHSITSSTTPQIVLEFHSSNLKILSHRSVEMAKYFEKLGINSLSISSFFTRYVFPVISEMPRTKILESMRYCKSKFRELCSGEEDFEQSIMNLKWIQCEDGTFRSAHELFDPNVPLFFSFFEKKSSFPPTWMPRDMFDFLKTLGMRTSLSMYNDSLYTQHSNHTGTTMDEQALLDCVHTLPASEEIRESVNISCTWCSSAKRDRFHYSL